MDHKFITEVMVVVYWVFERRLLLPALLDIPLTFSGLSTKFTGRLPLNLSHPACVGRANPFEARPTSGSRSTSYFAHLILFLATNNLATSPP